MIGLNNLQKSLSNLFEEFGRASPGLATVINLGFAGGGLLAYSQLGGIPAYLGLGLAIISLVAIVRWVIGV